MSQLPLIASFVVRLLQTGEDTATRRVMVRHVQTGKELRFLQLPDALTFMEESADQSPEPPTLHEE